MLTLSLAATLCPCQIISRGSNYSSLWCSIGATPTVVEIMCFLWCWDASKTEKTLKRFTQSSHTSSTKFIIFTIVHLSYYCLLTLFWPTSMSQQFQLTSVMESSTSNQTGLNAQCRQPNGSQKAESCKCHQGAQTETTDKTKSV